MKKIILILNVLLIFNFANSQELFGYVEYSLNIANDEKVSEGELGNFYKQAKDNASYVSYILNFNKNEMSFQSNTPEIDGVNLSFSFAFSGVHGLYYRKINESVVLNSIDDYILGKIILKRDLKINWTLHNESKKIQDFLCYKATATLKYNNGVGDFQKEIIVWYCPKIPYSFGPKGYGGLPGLILEFQEGNIVIGAKKIVFNKETKIIEPNGKTITETEYAELIKKHIESEK